MAHGHNVFITYKYRDSNVRDINGMYTTVRDYVDILQEKFKGSHEIYDYSEHDGEDLSDLSEDTIRSKLSDKIFYTSVTIVLVSPNMNDGRPEREQWIPWEISYSLQETRRASGRSGINGIVAVVLPDKNGSYGYVIEDKGCHWTIHYDRLFDIIRKNRHNRKNLDPVRCSTCGCSVHQEDSSYMLLTKWDIFVKNPESYIDTAIRFRNEANQFNIVKRLS